MICNKVAQNDMIRTLLDAQRQQGTLTTPVVLGAGFQAQTHHIPTRQSTG